MATIRTVVTDIAKKKISEMLLTGRGFQIKSFEAGSGGHDPLDLNIALTPDPTITELPQKTFGPKAVTTTEISGFFSPKITVVLEQNEAVGVVSNIGLLAEIVSSPVLGDPELGKTFLFAIGNTAHRVKLDSEQIKFNLALLF